MKRSITASEALMGPLPPAARVPQQSQPQQQDIRSSLVSLDSTSSGSNINSMSTVTTSTMISVSEIPKHVKAAAIFIKKLEECTVKCSATLRQTDALLRLPFTAEGGATTSAILTEAGSPHLRNTSAAQRITTAAAQAAGPSLADCAGVVPTVDSQSAIDSSSTVVARQVSAEADASLSTATGRAQSPVSLMTSPHGTVAVAKSPVLHVSTNLPPPPAMSKPLKKGRATTVEHAKALAIAYIRLADDEERLVSLTATYDRAVHGRNRRMLSSLSEAFAMAARLEAARCRILYRLSVAPEEVSQEAANELLSTYRTKSSPHSPGDSRKRAARGDDDHHQQQHLSTFSFRLAVDSPLQKKGSSSEMRRSDAGDHGINFTPERRAEVGSRSNSANFSSEDEGGDNNSTSNNNDDDDAKFVYETGVAVTMGTIKQAQRHLRHRSHSQAEGEADRHREQEVRFTSKALSVQRDLLLRADDEDEDLLSYLLEDENAQLLDDKRSPAASQSKRVKLAAPGTNYLSVPGVGVGGDDKVAGNRSFTKSFSTPRAVRGGANDDGDADDFRPRSVRPSVTISRVSPIRNVSATDSIPSSPLRPPATSRSKDGLVDLHASFGGPPGAVGAHSHTANVAALTNNQTVTTVKQVWTDVQLLQITLERGFSSYACTQFSIAANDFALIVKLLGKKCFAVEEIVLTAIDAIKDPNPDDGAGRVVAIKPAKPSSSSAPIAMERDVSTMNPKKGQFGDVEDRSDPDAHDLTKNGLWLLVALSKVHPDALPTKTLEEHCDLASVPAYDPGSVRNSALLSGTAAATFRGRPLAAYSYVATHGTLQKGGGTLLQQQQQPRPGDSTAAAAGSTSGAAGTAAGLNQVAAPHESFSLSVLFASLCWNVALCLWKDGFIRDAQRWLTNVDLDRLREIKEETEELEKSNNESGKKYAEDDATHRSHLSWRDVLHIDHDDESSSSSSSSSDDDDDGTGHESPGDDKNDTPAKAQGKRMKKTRKSPKLKPWTPYELATRGHDPQNRLAVAEHLVDEREHRRVNQLRQEHSTAASDTKPAVETKSQKVMRLAKQIAGLRDLCGLIRSCDTCDDLLYVITALSEAVIIEREEIANVKTQQKEARRQARGASPRHAKRTPRTEESGDATQYSKPVKEDATGEALHVAQILVEYFLARRTRRILRILCDNRLYGDTSYQPHHTPEQENEAAQRACSELIEFLSEGTISGVEGLSQRGICGSSARLRGPNIFTVNALVLTMSFASNYSRSKLYAGVVADEKLRHRTEMGMRKAEDGVNASASGVSGATGAHAAPQRRRVLVPCGPSNNNARGARHSQSNDPPGFFTGLFRTLLGMSCESREQPDDEDAAPRMRARTTQSRTGGDDSVAGVLFGLPNSPVNTASAAAEATATDSLAPQPFSPYGTMGAVGSRTASNANTAGGAAQQGRGAKSANNGDQKSGSGPQRRRTLSLIPQRPVDTVDNTEMALGGGGHIIGTSPGSVTGKWVENIGSEKQTRRTQSVFILPTTTAAGRIRALTLLPEEIDSDEPAPSEQRQLSSANLAQCSSGVSNDSTAQEGGAGAAVSMADAKREYRAVSLRLLTVLRRHRANQSLEPVDGGTLTVVVSELNKAIRLLQREMAAHVGEAWKKRLEERDRARQSTYSRDVREAERAAPPTAPQRDLPQAQALQQREDPNQTLERQTSSQYPGKLPHGSKLAPRDAIKPKDTKNKKRNEEDSEVNLMNVAWDAAPTYTPDISVDYTNFTFSTDALISAKNTVQEVIDEQRASQEADRPNSDNIPGVSILANAHRQLLHDQLSVINQFLPWRLIYSTRFHGVSYKTLLTNCAAELDGSPFLLIMRVGVKESDAVPVSLRATTRVLRTIGAYLSNGPRMGSHRYYGNSATFVFQFTEADMESASPPELRTFKSSRENEQYLNCRHDAIIVGGGRTGSALLINANLMEGATASCVTFDSPPLVFWNEVEGADANAVDRPDFDGIASSVGAVSFSIHQLDVIAFGNKM